MSVMSLRAFHLFFIGISVVLSAFFAAWAGAQYSQTPNVGYVVTAVASLASGVALVFYLTTFVKKTKRMS